LAGIFKYTSAKQFVGALFVVVYYSQRKEVRLTERRGRR